MIKGIDISNYQVGLNFSVAKSMGFEIQTFPESSNGDNYYRSVMRVRKMIGRSDTL